MPIVPSAKRHCHSAHDWMPPVPNAPGLLCRRCGHMAHWSHITPLKANAILRARRRHHADARMFQAAFVAAKPATWPNVA